MKLHVLIDRGGRILGATHLDPKATVQARPIPDKVEGHWAVEVDAPAGFRHEHLADVCRKMLVDTSGKAPRLTAAPEKGQ